jgi:hypothetical protein
MLGRRIEVQVTVPSLLPPLLLTSSVVVHDRGVKLTDPNERIRLALESVREWLRNAPDLRVVMCDGSGFDFSALVAEHFPGASIECLFFLNDEDLVRRHGRGYGEGEIVRHAINHSLFIAEAACFAKCSSKLWVENYAECLREWNGRMRFKGVFANVFLPWRKTELAYIDTRFYLISCADYRRYFEDAHKNIRKREGFGLEECFRDVIRDQKLAHLLLAVPPVIAGVGGGTGVYYRTSAKRRLKERLRVALIKAHSSFEHLF